MAASAAWTFALFIFGGVWNPAWRPKWRDGSGRRISGFLQFLMGLWMIAFGSLAIDFQSAKGPLVLILIAILIAGVAEGLRKNAGTHFGSPRDRDPPY
jgi:hypothetical protein